MALIAWINVNLTMTVGLRCASVQIIDSGHSIHPGIKTATGREPSYSKFLKSIEFE